MTMELTGDQLKMAEIQLKRYLPRSQQVYGCLVLRNRVRSDPMSVFVDRWPDFRVIVCKPQCEEKDDYFKDILVFANDEDILEEIIRKSSVIDWFRAFCVGMNARHMEILKAVASEKDVPFSKRSMCHLMTLEDVSNLPSIDSSGISLSSMDVSHVGLVNQMWKFGKSEGAAKMIRNMLANFPSYCVLDEEGKPVSWVLTYATCAMGMLFTLPEHRGKGYAKVLIITMAKRHHAQGYPVFCVIEEENELSYSLCKRLGFIEDPSHRETWYGFNGF